MTDSELEALFASHKGVDLSEITPFEMAHMEGLDAGGGTGSNVKAFGIIFGLVALWVLWAMFFAGRGGALSSGTAAHATNARAHLMRAKSLYREAGDAEDCERAQGFLDMAWEALGEARAHATWGRSTSVAADVNSLRRRLRKGVRVCKT